MDTLVGILPYIQIILAILLVIAILLQRSEAGMGSSFGGSDNFNSAFHTRRGFERVLFVGTIVIAILFAISLILAI